MHGIYCLKNIYQVYDDLLWAAKLQTSMHFLDNELYHFK